MKLLSPKSFLEFTAEEYHSYIKSLHKPKEYISTKKEQKELKVRVRRKKDGSLSIVTKRNPLYVTEKEFEKIAAETEIPKSELYSTLKERGFTIAPSHRDARGISRPTSEIAD